MSDNVHSQYDFFRLVNLDEEGNLITKNAESVTNIKLSDSTNMDAFGRLRVSNPFMLNSTSFTLTSGDTYYETIEEGTGISTFLSDESAFQFSVSSNGDKVIKEQHGYSYYQPGKSQLIFLTGVFGNGVENTIKNMGYYNNNDGLYFGYSGTTFGVCLRTSTTGVAVDTFIPQTDWNIDTLINGNAKNPSGYHLDLTKTNIYIINFQWLGVGRVIFGLDIDGVIVPVHQILNANNKTAVYMKTGNLPVRYEVNSQGGETNDFKMICSSVVSEGGQEDFGYPAVATSRLSAKSIVNDNRNQLISVRLSTIFDGIENRMKIEPLEIELYTSSNATGYWELVLQRSHLGENNLGGTPTWTQLDNTPIEYSTNGTTVNGGIVIASGYITAQSDKINSAIIPSKEFLSLNSSGDTSDWLHLVVQPLTNSNWFGAITVNCKY